jgi:PKHD-type hydroxylase
MFAEISPLLNPDAARQLCQQLSGMTWESGAGSAAAARNRKNNEQLTVATRAVQPALGELGQAVLNHPEVRRFAEPKFISRIFFGRYGEGMYYGTHNDGPITSGGGPGPGRADVSFTIFLSDPDSYEGGELVLESPFGEAKIKPPAGHAVIYDTGLMHRVDPVTSGQRVVTVGWIQSWIQDPMQRAILRDVKDAIRESGNRDNDSEETIRLRRIYASLVRRWAS